MKNRLVLLAFGIIFLTACGSESKGGGSPDSATTTIREKEKNRGVDNKSAGSDSTGTGKNTGKPK